MEAKLEWQYQDKELAQADAIIRNPQAFKEQFNKDDGNQETEEFLKNQQQDCLININRDRKAIDKLSDIWKTFEDALEIIKDGTGYESIDELIQQFEAYEDEVSLQRDFVQPLEVISITRAEICESERNQPSHG